MARGYTVRRDHCSTGPMASFSYSPDNTLRVHQRGAIQLLCLPFQSHENGLPEWLKNAADAYARQDAPESRRVIVVIFDYGRSGSAPSISCLDFCGMTSSAIENRFRVWADPTAARKGTRGNTIQGGHGNGGKAYMAQMFEEHAIIHTVSGGKGNHYGVGGGTFRFGYIPDRPSGRDVPVVDVASDLAASLEPVGCGLHTLPEAARTALNESQGYTLIKGVGPKGYGSKIPVRQLVTTLQQHPQMIRTLELCGVYVIVKGKVYNRGKSLTPPEITPIEGAEEPRLVPIPPVLVDPVTNERVTTDDSGAGQIILRTSKASMRWKKMRHNIVYVAQSGYVGYVPVTELEVQSAYRNHLYGECRLAALEAFKQNERARLATSPLTRAVERFVAAQIEQYAREFEEGDLRKYDQAEKTALIRMNEALDQWKNRCLNTIRKAHWRENRGNLKGPKLRLPLGRLAQIEIWLAHRRAGLGVAIRPRLRCLDADGWQIRKPAFRWVSSNPKVLRVEENNTLITVGTGQASLSAQTLDREHRSNRLRIRVVEVEEIRVEPRKIEMTPGGRHELDVECRLGNGERTSRIFLAWSGSDELIARVSPSGIVYGGRPGVTEVVVGDTNCSVSEPVEVRVLAAADKRNRDVPGQGYPVVLISGEVDSDPETKEHVHFGPDDPPVCQRVEDVERNVWWINSAAPLAQLYLDSTTGYGYHSREWRIYHLERYVEIIVQIVLSQEMDAQTLNVDDWIVKWGTQVVEIQSVAAQDLNSFIATGELPSE